MMRVLADGTHRNRRMVYVLAGNEPMEACFERATKVLEWGGVPHVQPVIKLNALEKRPWVRFDWTEQRLRDFARYFNRKLWKFTPIAGYSSRPGGPTPFKGVFKAAGFSESTR